MDRLSSPLLTLFANLGARSPQLTERPEWKEHFAGRGVPGTIVVFEPALDRYSASDEARVKQRFLPAATFDIVNAVAGFDSGAIACETEVFPWDGKARYRVAHERDHVFASAMRDNVDWVFQDVARRMGKARMRDWLERFEYGNRDMAGGVDLFWLQGGLRVSALEQVKLLHRLAESRLPATHRAQRAVRSAMVLERTRDYTLYARSGSSGRTREPVEWWVGWIEKKGKPAAYFAMNFEPGERRNAADAQAIVRPILQQLGALPK